jgi:signal transduction histidine kinase
MHILLVDDEKIITQSLGAVLADLGYEVGVANSGEEALESLETSAYDLVVSDIRMAGMNGIELLSRARAHHPDLPVIMMTGQGSEGIASEALKRGACNYLCKPVRVRDLVNAIGQVERQLVLRDDLCQTKRKLLDARRMASLGVLATSVAREINTPAICIRGNSELLARHWAEIAPILRAREVDGSGGETSAELPQLVAGVRDYADRILQVVREVGWLAENDSVRSHRKASALLSYCFDEALSVARHSLPRATEIVRAGDETQRVAMDPEQLTHVLIHLLTNAGCALSAAARAQPLLAVRAQRESDWVDIEVEDNGAGIAADMQELVFAPFCSNKPSDLSAGLGLALCRDIVEVCGGRIGFSSKVDEYTRFWLRLRRIEG